MKKLLTAMALALGLAVTHAQVVAPVNPLDTNSPAVKTAQGWLNALSGTNLVLGAGALYDTTTKKAGGEIWAKYDLGTYVGALVALDYMNHSVYSVNGSAQLQLPIQLGSTNSSIYLIPYGGAGIGTPLSGPGLNSGGVVYKGFLGAGLQFTPHWGIYAHIERWSGSGFNDNMFAIGTAWKF
jgi:hypothetical protein